MRSEGEYFCPACFAMRDFILADERAEAEKLPDLECWVCGYTYTTVTTERHNGPPLHQHPITAEMRHRAKAKLRAGLMDRVLSNGMDRETITQGRLKRGRRD